MNLYEGSERQGAGVRWVAPQGRLCSVRDVILKFEGKIDR